MTIPSLELETNTSGRLMEADKNDCYVLKHCLIYLLRHLKRFPSYSRQTCKMLVWTVGSNIDQVLKILMGQFDRNQRSKYIQELEESDHDVEDYADFLSKMLSRIKVKHRRKVFQRILSQLEYRLQSLSFRGKSDFEENILAVKKMFSLTEKETEFINFLFINSAYEQSKDFFVGHLECQKIIGHKYLINILDINKTQLQGLLTGNLKKIGILEIDNYDIGIEDEFLNLFQNSGDKNFSQNFYFKIKPGNVPLENYFFKEDQINHVLKLLKNKPISSTHILLYGPPGTGKTSFAYSLTRHLDIPSHEIVRCDENTASKRRAAILACLNLTNTGEGSLVVVDEADNILNTQNSWLTRGETQDKGWLNQLLETPGSRIIWITNSIQGIEESVLRRFAFNLQFKTFNRSQRIELWCNIALQNKCKRFFKPKDIEAFAKNYQLSAGVIDLAIKKTTETRPGSKTEFLETVKIALEAHDTLLHYGEKPINKDRIEKKYTLDGLNVGEDLSGMIRQLNAFDKHLRTSDINEVTNMNLLFYGPPGTGKSELARYIGNRLDREIICKRISDLQSMYVGEGEKNIKRAFLEAENEEAILIIDEADSLLFSRDRARHSWEISFTNEFLTQMEKYRGILICTTNRLTDLDKASLRRFNHKIGFDYLEPDGNVIFYDKLLADLISAPLNDTIRQQLRQIRDLSPGDFKTVRDKFKFHPKSELKHQVLLQALSEESYIKNPRKEKRSIGFLKTESQSE